MREYWLRNAKTATDDFLQVFQVYILLVGGAKKSCFYLRSHSSLQWIILPSPQSSLSAQSSLSLTLSLTSVKSSMIHDCFSLSYHDAVIPLSPRVPSKLLDELGWNSPLHSLFGGSPHSIFYLSYEIVVSNDSCFNYTTNNHQPELFSPKKTLLQADINSISRGERLVKTTTKQHIKERKREGWGLNTVRGTSTLVVQPMIISRFVVKFH